MQLNSISEFVRKLYMLLETKENEKYISWNSNGTSIKIFNSEIFSSKVLNKAFNHKNWSSFVRQLNKYDFHKIKDENEINDSLKFEYYHKFFQRGRVDLLEKIKRKKTEAENCGASPNPIEKTLESYMLYQSHVLNTVEKVSKYIQVLINDIKELKKLVNRETIGYKKKPMEVIIIEDSPLRPLFNVLKQTAYSLTSVEMNENVYGLFIKKRYDIILIDINPLSFRAIIQNIRSNCQFTPIILITDNLYTIDVGNYISMGADEILCKPFHINTLLQLFDKYELLKDASE